jgi:hypothetical protein
MVRAMTSRSSLIHPTLALHLTGHVLARDDNKKHFFHGRHLVLHVAKTVYESVRKKLKE